MKVVIVVTVVVAIVKMSKHSHTNLSNIDHDLIVNFLLDGRMYG